MKKLTEAEKIANLRQRLDIKLNEAITTVALFSVLAAILSSVGLVIRSGWLPKRSSPKQQTNPAPLTRQKVEWVISGVSPVLSLFEKSLDCTYHDKKNFISTTASAFSSYENWLLELINDGYFVQIKRNDIKSFELFKAQNEAFLKSYSNINIDMITKKDWSDIRTKLTNIISELRHVKFEFEKML